jgi:heat-inducible transcriptional repressor
VDELLKVAKLPAEEREQMQEHLKTRGAQVEAIIRRAANVISDATKYTAVIVAPRLSTLRIRHVQIVPVTDDMALLIIVTNAGIVRDATISIPAGISSDILYGISRMLTEQLADKPIEQVRQVFAELLRDMGQNRRLVAEAMQVIEEKMDEGDSADVVVGGSSNLLSYPEYSDMEKARSFLAVLESKEMLRKLVGSGGGMEINIRIGPENEVPELKDCSVITASYRVSDRSTGTMAIIGPTRMNYNRTISVLQYVGRELSDLLSDR